MIPWRYDVAPLPGIKLPVNQSLTWYHDMDNCKMKSSDKNAWLLGSDTCIRIWVCIRSYSLQLGSKMHQRRRKMKLKPKNLWSQSTSRTTPGSQITIGHFLLVATQRGWDWRSSFLRSDCSDTFTAPPFLTAEAISQKTTVGLSHTSIIAAFQQLLLPRISQR